MPRRGPHHEPEKARHDRSLALRAFLLASLLWIAGISVTVFAWDKDVLEASRLWLWVYGCALAFLSLLALASAGTAIASLLSRRRGKRIAWAALAMSLPPLGLSLLFLLKLFFDHAG